MKPPELILGSSSPYRRQLLERLGLPFRCVSAAVDESPLPGEAPASTAERLAALKARAVAAKEPRALVIASDQVAELHGMPLNKPGTHANAVRQLRQMRGQRVLFHTALCVVDFTSAHAQSAMVPTIVHMRELTDAQIENYLQREQPYDCAGSAKIESLGIALVSKVESDDPTALIGLPLIALVSMLTNVGVAIL